MKLSKYNWLVDMDDSLIIYNGFTGAMANIHHNNRIYVTKLLNTTEHELSLNSDYKELNQGLQNLGFILPDESDELYIMEQIFNARKYSLNINHITIVPTYDCNFACKYCFEADREDLHLSSVISDDVIDRIVDISAISRDNTFSITLFGGEPLLELDKCLQLSSKVREKVEDRGARYLCYLVTNGYYLTATNAKRLSASGVSAAQVTIDGNRDSHDKLRILKNGGGTFDRIVDNVVSASEYLAINVRITIDKEYNMNADSLMSLLDSKNINYYVSPVKWQLCDKRGSTEKNRDATFSINPDTTLFRESINAITPGCTATDMTGMTVTPDGTILRCWEEVGSGVNYGNVLDVTVPDLLKSRKWLEWNPYQSGSKCRACRMLPTCGGGCPSDSMSKDHNSCMYTQRQYIEYIKTNYRKRASE